MNIALSSNIPSIVLSNYVAEREENVRTEVIVRLVLRRNRNRFNYVKKRTQKYISFLLKYREGERKVVCPKAMHLLSKTMSIVGRGNRETLYFQFFLSFFLFFFSFFFFFFLYQHEPLRRNFLCILLKIKDPPRWQCDLIHIGSRGRTADLPYLGEHRS